MYSIPVYALRFAAHCRSRLKYTEAGVSGGVHGAMAGASRFWARIAAHESRASLTGKCANQRVVGATP